jgi:BASS family bile acid:Na+ symporter
MLDYATLVVTLILLTTVGLDLRPADFARVRERPGMVAAGVLGPPLLLPSVAVGVIAWLEPPPTLASSLLLLACCPTGGISNTYSYLARASVALSVTLTAVSCALAVVTIPGTALVVDRLWHHAMPIAVPLRALAGQVIFAIALPIAAGMGIRARWPVFAERSNATLQRVGFLLLACLLALVFSGTFGVVTLDLVPGVVLSLAFILGAFAVGGVTALAFGGTPADGFTLSTEFATRNIAVATALALSFGTFDLALFCALYFVCELPILLVAAFAFRRLYAVPSLAGSASTRDAEPSATGGPAR